MIKVAKRLDCFKEHSELAIKIQESLFREKGIKMNIDGANSAILSDMGFDWKVGCGIFIIGRVPGLLAHINEEMASEKPFRKVFDMQGL